MNLKQAFQALVDGQKIRGTKWFESSYVTLTDDGTELLDEAGNLYELGQEDGPDFEVYTEMKRNPYPRGCFAWARFESEQNNKVVRRPFCVQRKIGPGNSTLTLADLDATDWQVM